MLVRVFEYSALIGIAESDGVKKETLTINLPHSAIIYLRHSNKMPGKMEINICTPGGKVSYDVPVLKVKTYSVEEIFEKKLLFLIPFHIFKYENDFSKFENDERELAKLLETYEKITDKLNKMAFNREVSTFTVKTIEIATKTVLEQIAKNYKKVMEGVENFMVGRALQYEAKDIFNEGIEQGIEQGRKEERAKILHELKNAEKIARENAALRKKIAQLEKKIATSSKSFSR